MTKKAETLERKDYSQAERDEMDDSDFGDPENQAFPIKVAADVIHAASRLHNASGDQAAIKARIKRIAKRKGFPLPQTWQDEDKDSSKERTMPSDDTLTRAVSADHEPMTTTHTHSHPDFGSQGDDDSQGDDETHSHEHSHENDNDHKHPSQHESADERAESGTIQTSDRPTMYAPFLRIDAAKREVIGQATAEVPDSYKTIFGYYPEAFEMWRGNIREQHDPKKAVGRRVDFFSHDDTRSVDLQSRISRGAQDTWLKVEDNVLTGYSLSVIPDPEFGNDVSKWPKKEYEGKLYPYLPRYSIAEVSLVDNPACPGCNIQIVRADGFATDVLDTTEEETHPESVASSSGSSLDRAGARVSSSTRDAMHDSIGHTLHAAVSQMKNCGCDNCNAAMKTLDPDNDGDIDFGGYDDTDGDAENMAGGDDGDMERTITGLIERILEKQLTPVYARLQGIAGTLSRSNAAPTEASLNTLISGAIERAVQSAATVNESSLAEVRASQGAVKEQVDAIAKQVDAIANTPVPGAPVMNAGALPRPVEKRLATDPYQAPQRSGSSVYDAIASAWAYGQLDTPEKQTDAMAAGLLAQRGRR